MKAALAFGLALTLVSVRLFIGHPVRVHTTSMAPAFWPGAVVWVWTAAEPRLGDVVLWRPAAGEAPMLKRLVGQGGDQIQVVQVQLTRNGAALATGEEVVVRVPVGGGRVASRAALMERGGVAILPGGGGAEVSIGEGEVYLLGDNRAVSEDSRQWGPASVATILGVVGPVIWKPTPE